MRMLRNRRSAAALLTLVAVLSSLSGCGYSFRAPYDKSVRTVFVPIFRSQTFRRDLNLQLNEMICKEIERRTPYKVVGTLEGADTILSGMINYDLKNTVVENPDNLPRQLNATLSVSVTWTQNPPSEDDKRRGPTVIGETVNFSPELGETAMTAFYKVNQNLATQVVDMMEQPWFAGKGID